METDKSEFPPDGSLEQLGVIRGSGVETAQGKGEEAYPGLGQDHPQVLFLFFLLFLNPIMLNL